MAVKASTTITISCYRDTDKVTRYYILQSSTISAPETPTTNPPSDDWTTSEPGYTSGSTNSLYFVDLTEFSDGTWLYSEVSLSSSYEAAKEAYNKATSVESRIETAEDSINLIVETYAEKASLALEIIKDEDTGKSIATLSANANYIYLTGGQLIIDSDNFTLDADGNATFSGELSAATGTFKGTLNGVDGDFSGTITAEGGSIGPWSITSAAIYRTSSTYGASGGMYFGTSGLSLGSTFKVSSGGAMTCTSGTIGGWTIGSASLTASGSLTDTYVYSYTITLSPNSLNLHGYTSSTSYGYQDVTLLPTGITVAKRTSSSSSATGITTAQLKTSNIGIAITPDEIDFNSTYSSATSWLNATQLILNGSYGNDVPIEINNGTYGIRFNIGSGGSNRGIWDCTSTFGGISGLSGRGAWVLYLNSSNYVYLQAERAYMYAYNSSKSAYSGVWVNGGGSDRYAYFRPTHNGEVTLGTASYLWTKVYSSSSSISTSDARLKENIVKVADDERYETFFDNLTPVIYSWKNKEGKHPHDRRHSGMIAQEVYNAMESAGLTDLDFGGYCYDNFINGEFEPNPDREYDDLYSLAYEEFIGLNIYMTQKNKSKIEELTDRIEKLESENEKLKNQVGGITS